MPPPGVPRAAIEDGELAGERLQDAIVAARLDWTPCEREDVEVVELDLPARGAVGHRRADGVRRASSRRPLRWNTAAASSAKIRRRPSRSIGPAPRRPGRRVLRPRRGLARRRLLAGRRARRRRSRRRQRRGRPKGRAGSRPRSIVNVWIGGVKYQLTSRNPTTAAERAGHTPPTAEIATTRRRKRSSTLGSPSSVRRSLSSQVSSGSPTAAEKEAEQHAAPWEGTGAAFPGRCRMAPSSRD